MTNKEYYGNESPLEFGAVAFADWLAINFQYDHVVNVWYSKSTNMIGRSSELFPIWENIEFGKLFMIE